MIWKMTPAPTLALVATLGLSACESQTPEDGPEAQNINGSRSIFQDDASEQAAGQTDRTLPPLRTILSFADGTTDLTEAVRAELVTIAGSPQVEAGGLIVLRGHSDSVGSDEDALAASRERAEAARDFLVETGIAEEQIRIIAFGEQNPREPNALPDGTPNEAGRAANRRVHVTVRPGPEAVRQPTLIESLTEDEDAAGTGDPAAAAGPAETGNP